MTLSLLILYPQLERWPSIPAAKYHEVGASAPDELGINNSLPKTVTEEQPGAEIIQTQLLPGNLQ